MEIILNEILPCKPSRWTGSSGSKIAEKIVGISGISTSWPPGEEQPLAIVPVRIQEVPVNINIAALPRMI